MSCYPSELLIGRITGNVTKGEQAKGFNESLL